MANKISSFCLFWVKHSHNCQYGTFICGTAKYSLIAIAHGWITVIVSVQFIFQGSIWWRGWLIDDWWGLRWWQLNINVNTDGGHMWIKGQSHQRAVDNWKLRFTASLVPYNYFTVPGMSLHRILCAKLWSEFFAFLTCCLWADVKNM